MVSAVGSGTVDIENTLITKLENILLDLDSRDQTRTPVQLRLADLYSERARKLEQLVVCQSGCPQVRQDRERAIAIYEEAVKTIDVKSKRRVVAQMAYLFESLGKIEKATSFYKSLLNGVNDSKISYIANWGLANIAYDQQQYTRALRYLRVINKSSQKNKDTAEAMYKTAWSYYHTNKPSQAINSLERYLRDYSKVGEDGIGERDQVLYEQVINDLISFYAEENAGFAKVKTLLNYSPKSKQLQHLFKYASELLRLSHKTDAYLVFEFLNKQQLSKPQRVQTLGTLLVLSTDLNSKKPMYTKYLQKYMAVLRSLKEDSPELFKEEFANFREFIVAWHRKEKDVPSDDLFTAYKNFNRLESGDLKMVMWSVDIAKKKKQWATARNWLKVAVDQDTAKQATGKLDLEFLLLQYIEVAELSDDNAMLEDSLRLYLTKTVKGTKRNDSRYRLAYLKYEAKKYEEAALAFHELALSEGTVDMDIREKSINLALDSLALLKDNERLVSWSQKFMTISKSGAAHVKDVMNNASLNEVVALSKGGKHSKAVVVLSKIDSKDLNLNKKKIFHKNAVLLYEKQNNLTKAIFHAYQFVRLPLTKTESRWGFLKLSWFEELKLNFAKSHKHYLAYLKYKVPNKGDYYKLVALAGLAGRSVTSYYKMLFALEEDKSVKKELLSTLLETNSNWEELWKNRNLFSKSEFVRKNIELYSKRPNKLLAKRILKHFDPKGSVFLLHIQREKQIADLGVVVAKIKKFKLKSRNNRKTIKAINLQEKRIAAIEKMFIEANKQNDWLMQTKLASAAMQGYLVTASAMERMPIPRGLKKNEVREYRRLLKEKAKPYRAKADEYNNFRLKLADQADSYLYVHKKIFENDSNRFVKVYLAKILRNETKHLDKNQHANFVRLSKNAFTTRSVSKKQLAFKSRLKKNPLSEDLINELLDSSRQNMDSQWKNYLKARIENIKKYKREINHENV